ncbi:MAG TPA: aminotransferase class V-fold PLP-dependent enzyme [bacterium]|jgi:aspartate aminotransferase-like enzyme
MAKIMNYSPAAADARERWKKYLSQGEIYPRDDDFSRLLRDVKTGLQKLCHSEAQVLLLTTAGTGALECAIAGLPEGKRIVVLRNGYFGQRLFEIAQLHHPDAFPYDLPFGEPFNSAHEARLIQLLKEKRADVLIGVHLETSSTVVNDAALLGKIGREHQLITVVDGISSIGAVECRLDEWGVNCFVASVYKALMCPTGLSFIVADSAFLNTSRRNWSYYFDLQRLSDAAEGDRYLWSPSVLSLQCLRDTVEEILAVGQEAYFEKLEAKARQFRRRLERGGLQIFGDPQHLSPCLTAIKTAGQSATQWLARLKKQYGVVVGKGMGEFAEDYLRIGHYPHRSARDLANLAEALAETSR